VKSSAPRPVRGARWMLTTIIAAGVAACPAAFAQHGDVNVLHVQGNVYLLHTPAANMTVQAADDGILIVDTLSAELTDRIYTAIAPLSAKPIQNIVNTHAHVSHTGGNAGLAAHGRSVFGGNVAGVVDSQVLDSSARIIAHENVLLTMSAEDPARDFEDWPTDVFYTDRKELFFNGEGVQIFHQPAAHTNGDSIVYFRRSDVISTGEIFNSHEFPVIDLDAGGSVQGVIDALNTILDLALPALLQEGGTMIIPGRGRLCDEADVLEYRDMVVIVRDRIQDAVDKGLSLRQVQAARPTLGYDWQYGRANDDWTGEDFVAAIYRDLSPR